MPRAGPRYRGRPEPPKGPPKRPPPKKRGGPLRPEPRPRPKRRKKRKRTWKETDTLLTVAEEEYGTEEMAGEIARANPQIRNYTAGVRVTLPEPEPEPEEPTYIDYRLKTAVPPPQPPPVRERRQRRGAPGRRRAPALPAPIDFGLGSTLATPVAGTPAPPQPFAQQPPTYTPFAGLTSPLATPAGPPAPTGGVERGSYTAPGPGGTQLFEYDENGRPLAVVGVTGEVAYGTSIIPYLLEQGIAPLMISPYDVRVNGIDVNLLLEYGYTKNDWGNWVAPAFEEAPVAEEVAGGGGGIAGYGGWPRRGGGGGGGRPVGPGRMPVAGRGAGARPSYTGRERLNMLAHGQISWRI